MLALTAAALRHQGVAMRPLRVVVVSGFYSEGMGYSENCLPRSLAALGHDVHLLTSTYNVYGNEPSYDTNYRAFLGPPRVPSGSFAVDGYQVHRMPTTLVSGYLRLQGLAGTIRSLKPDVVHSLEIASLQTISLALAKPRARHKLFCETHQHMSVVKPYMKANRGSPLKRLAYRATRTLPIWLASLAVEKCYAISPDCVEVAARMYGVPRSKIRLLSLGTDTALFHPPDDDASRAARASLRRSLGFGDDDIVCVYTGRFSQDKNPLLLAKAIQALSATDLRFKGLFIGDGEQKGDIVACRNSSVLSFMRHADLAAHYRACDIAVWPSQESMSMLDAAASGLPLVASDTMGEAQRVSGNGRHYREASVESMQETLQSLADPEVRQLLGSTGRRKMVDGFSWTRFAQSVQADYYEAVGA
jgi:glycosyltransferase involved in cell wall biosynthesis